MKLLKKNSLRLRLIFTLSCTALLIWSISTAIAWFSAREEVNKMFDAQQVLFAKRLANTSLREILVERQQWGGFRQKNKQKNHKRKKHYDDDALAFAIFSRDGELLLSDDAEGNNFIFAPTKGFATTTLANDKDPWRIFWLPSEDKRLLVAVGQEVDYRDDLINEMVLGQMWVWVAGLPVLIALMILLINRELKTLNQVGNQMRKRSPDDHQPLSMENIPDEISPLVTGLNGFFDRTSAMLLRERRFTSDAAHELRSPLAGLRIQAEVAQMLSDDPKLRDDALDNLISGIDRASQLIEQLLTLSRLDNLNQLENSEQIHWESLINSVIKELAPSAEKRNMQIHFESTEPSKILQGQSLLLSLMVRNIIDNAIKYAKDGAEIRVKLQPNELIIQDNGGGVAEQELTKLGQRFYRPAGQNEKGSGLGLSIVHRIAELHHIKVRLENVKNSQNEVVGLRVLFYFP